MGWWAYEAPKGLRHPGYEYQRSVLWEANVLGEEERAQLETEWRREWDHIWEHEQFFHSAAPDKIYSGDEARVKHLVWADVPPVLVYRWLDERERLKAA